jgi:transposase
MCIRRTFAERFGEPIKAYAHRTTRCAARLQTIGLLLGGNAGALLAKRMGLPVSADTLLRLIRALEVPQRATPEVLGIDDFALRKGQKYGTILVDVENHCLVDLLPDREKATVMAWMKAHPGVKVVSRDRGVTYADVQMEGESCRFKKKYLPLSALYH